jgi:hypothetical protein
MHIDKSNRKSGTLEQKLKALVRSSARYPRPKQLDAAFELLTENFKDDPEMIRAIVICLYWAGWDQGRKDASGPLISETSAQLYRYGAGRLSGILRQDCPWHDGEAEDPFNGEIPF